MPCRMSLKLLNDPSVFVCGLARSEQDAGALRRARFAASRECTGESHATNATTRLVVGVMAKQESGMKHYELPGQRRTTPIKRAGAQGSCSQSRSDRR
jgi:hypothetical protein